MSTLHEDLGELRAALQDLGNEILAELRNLRFWAFACFVITWVGLGGMLAKGFGWL